MNFFRRKHNKQKHRKIVRFRRSTSEQNQTDETFSRSNSSDDGAISITTSQAEDMAYYDEDADIVLQLGKVKSIFIRSDGSWLPKPSGDKNSSRNKLLTLKIRNDKLLQENKKLRLKFDILFDLAKATTKEFAEISDELQKLRHILKKNDRVQRD